MEDGGFVNNEIMVHHLSSLEVSIRGQIMHHSIHYKTNILRLIASLRNGLTLAKSLSFEFFQVFGVKVVVTVLQKSVDFDGIFVQELCQLGLKG